MTANTLSTQRHRLTSDQACENQRTYGTLERQASRRQYKRAHRKTAGMGCHCSRYVCRMSYKCFLDPCWSSSQSCSYGQNVQVCRRYRQTYFYTDSHRDIGFHVFARQSKSFKKLGNESHLLPQDNP